MEYGKIRQDGLAEYASEVTNDEARDISAFYRRVQQWTSRVGLVLGEGIVIVESVEFKPPKTKAIIMRAPILSSDGRDPNAFGVFGYNNEVGWVIN